MCFVVVGFAGTSNQINSLSFTGNTAVSIYLRLMVFSRCWIECIGVDQIMMGCCILPSAGDNLSLGANQ